jgi:hypothetical protein
LDEIEENSVGINVNEDIKVSVLPFADDIILFGKDNEEAQVQIDRLQKYLGKLGMKISGEKSLTFQVVTKRNTWFIKKPRVSIRKQ